MSTMNTFKALVVFDCFSQITSINMDVRKHCQFYFDPTNNSYCLKIRGRYRDLSVCAGVVKW